MTPVYHAFARVIKAADRRLVECPLAVEDGKYVLDIDRWDAQMTGDEKIFILCSPHNPGGRVWTQDELEQIADFCTRHDLLLVSDEIHHDLLMPAATHIPMATLGGISERLIMMTAPTKTFNIAGCHTGNVIIDDPDLRAKFAQRLAALGLSVNSFGIEMTRAAYSEEGAEWLDQLLVYLDGSRALFDAAIAKIPGATSMRLEATYLAWVDFSGTGMSPQEIQKRVQEDAQIAASHGGTFGLGGESYLRFNLAMPRAQIEDACARLQKAFADLQ